jgi:hypothetical protein
MIKHNALSNRLNAIKSGKEPPIPENLDNDIEKILKDKQQSIASSLIAIPLTMLTDIIYTIVSSVLYGYGGIAIASLFITLNWGFFEISGIGFLITKILSLIISAKKKLKLF